MSARFAVCTGWVVGALVACGGAKARPEAAPVLSSSTSDAGAAAAVVAPPPPPEAPPPEMPTGCSPATTYCTPPSAFVDRLCGGLYLDAAMTLFSGDSPWTRGYLAGDVDGWYASGGASARAKLSFDEEVLVLRFREPPKGGIVVSNGGSYDVLRWDGLCYTLDAGEFTTRRPPKAKRAAIPFQRLGPRLQTLLLADPHVKGAHDKLAKECHGVTQGEVSLACVHADEALSAAVAEYVHAHKLPAPDRIP